MLVCLHAGHADLHLVSNWAEAWHRPANISMHLSPCNSCSKRPCSLSFRSAHYICSPLLLCLPCMHDACLHACNAQELAVQLRRDFKPVLSQRGARLLMVSIGTPERSKDFVAKTGFPAEDLFVDPGEKGGPAPTVLAGPNLCAASCICQTSVLLCGARVLTVS